MTRRAGHLKGQSSVNGYGNLRSGFALVVTISLMVLLSMMALGLLGLSTITMRRATLGQARSEARANARLAMVLAIGQLQEELGPDRRISAAAGILDEGNSSGSVANPHFSGVWEAAEEVSGDNLHKPDYDKEQSFRSWLVSSPEMAAGETGPAGLDMARNWSPGAEPVAHLLRDGGSGGKAGEVTVPMIESERFRVAWWTADEGLKARVRARTGDDPKSVAETVLNSSSRSDRAYGVLDAGLPDTREVIAKSFTLPTLDITAGGLGNHSYSDSRIHDLTVWSESVPVDVTTGRLKRDLNLWLEFLQQQGEEKRGLGGTLGPFASADRDYRVFSWDQLRHYYSQPLNRSLVKVDRTTNRPYVTSYKQTGYKGGKDDLENNPDVTRERWRIHPVLLKTVYIVSYGTEKLTKLPNPDEPERNLGLRLYIYPVPVLWNPYNVDLVVPEYLATGSALPVMFNIKTDAENLDLDFVKKQMSVQCAFGPEMPVRPEMTNIKIPAGTTMALYPRSQDTSKGSLYRHPRFRWDYYFWMQQGHFDCGPNNYGGVVKNLKGEQSVAYFDSLPAEEIVGRADEKIRIAIRPSSTRGVSGYWAANFKLNGEHTDWHGNNGGGTDDLGTLLRFGETTGVGFRFEAGSPQVSVISEHDLPNRSFGELQDTPTPLFLFEVYRKALDEDLFPSKNWAFSMPSHPVHGTTSGDQGTSDRVTPWFENAYTFRFKAVNSWIDVSERMQLSPDRDDRIFFGSSYSPDGQLAAVAQEIPLGPPTSLADLGHLPLFDFRPEYESKRSDPFGFGLDWTFHDGRLTQFPQNNAIGNSYASPGIRANAITHKGWNYFWASDNGRKHLRVDRSYVANSLLWDRWFCSSLGSQDGVWFRVNGAPRSLQQVATDFFEGTNQLPVENHVAKIDRPAEEVIDELMDSRMLKEEAHELIARNLRVAGGFNVNSTSEEAWAQFLGSMFSRPVVVMDSRSETSSPEVLHPAYDRFTVSRFSLANGGPAERENGKAREDLYWNGMRELTTEQIRELSTAIVKEVRNRGPFRSLAEFVNRRVDSDVKLALSGCLQTALDDEDVSINAPLRDLQVTGGEGTSAGRPRYEFRDAAAGPLKQGIPGYVMQGDLLRVLGPSITVRSDTFTIRAAGQSLTKDGQVAAEVWCEAVVQREADYIDSTDEAEIPYALLKSDLNRQFGRKFKVVSFRWLAVDEV